MPSGFPSSAYRTTFADTIDDADPLSRSARLNVLSCCLETPPRAKDTKSIEDKESAKADLETKLVEDDLEKKEPRHRPLHGASKFWNSLCEVCRCGERRRIAHGADRSARARRRSRQRADGGPTAEG